MIEATFVGQPPRETSAICRTSLGALATTIEATTAGRSTRETSVIGCASSGTLATLNEAMFVGQSPRETPAIGWVLNEGTLATSNTTNEASHVCRSARESLSISRVGRIVSLFVLLLMFCPWPTIAAERGEKTASKKTERPQKTIIQVADVEVASSAPEVLDGALAPLETTTVVPELEQPGARSWTLPELEAIANTSHPLLQRDLSRIDSARGDALQAGLYPNPRFDTNNPQVFAGQNSTFNAGVQQEFVVMGKKRLDRAAGVKVVQQNEFAYVQDRFGLLTASRRQFYIVLAAERRVRALKKLRDVTSSSVETGRKLQADAGEIPPIDVLVLRIDNERVEAELENRVRILRGERKQLAALVGDRSIGEDQFEGNLYVAPPQYDEEIISRFATLDSAYVQIQKLEIERNEILLQRACVEPYPNVNLGPAYQWGLTNGSEQFWLTVTFPIPTWDRNQGNIQSSRAEVAASRMNLEAIQLDQLRQVADTFSQHRGLRMKAAKYKDEIIPNTLRTLQLAKDGYRKGEYDFPRFLQIQRTFVEVNMDYIDLLENVWTTAAQLSGLLQLESF